MYLPINGRIAIIDNEIKEVRPLFKTFSKNRIPYIYIDGSDMDYLPDEDNELNDIRLLFLDLNLTGNRTPNSKEIKSSLFPVLKRVISPNNFPYTIVLWSKQENDYKTVVEELFNNELKDRQPISIEAFIKSDYFELDAEEEKQSDKDIINEIKILFQNHQAYSTLVYWENKVHKSADNTLQNIFTAHSPNWENKTNFIIQKLSQAYLGFTNHKNAQPIIRTKGALQAFNNIFYDTLESQINILSNLDDHDHLEFKDALLEKEEILNKLNFRLLASDTELELDYTGSVIEDKNSRSDKIFKAILSEVLNYSEVKKNIENFNLLSKTNQEKEISKKRGSIRENWKKVYTVVTPLCDKVQNKHTNIRVVKGFIIPSRYSVLLDKKSEAVYISPSFYLEDMETSVMLVLNFRYFFTFTNNKKTLDTLKDINILFRLRSAVIAEIQSKLARHVTRQGILYV